MKKIRGDVLQKKEDHLPLHEVLTIVQDPPKIVEVKSPLNTSSSRLPITSRVNSPHFKCIHMVGKYAYSRDVIESLTSNANIVGRPSMLKENLRSLIRGFGGVVLHNIII